jgi:two-component system, OmpR family, response regulator RegX3
MRPHILVADDDLELCELLGFALRRAGYEVTEVSDGEQALRSFSRQEADLVILDANMPKMDGFVVCQHLRARSDVPIIMLTVRDQEHDILRGFDLGADDYVVKPFSPKLLLARVRAVLKRSSPPLADSVTIGDLAFDISRQEVTCAKGKCIRLTPMESRLLQVLIANVGRPRSRESLVEGVWGYTGEGDYALLKNLVRRLRLKIEPDPSAPRYIKTLPGVGYILDIQPDAMSSTSG